MPYSMSDSEEREFVDILELDPQEGEELDLNLEEDYYANPRPIPDGKYKVKVFLVEGQEFEKIKMPEGRGTHYRANIVCRVQEGEYEGYDIYGNVSTVIPRGKNICSMAALIRAMKLQPQAHTTTTALCISFKKAIEKERMVIAETQWQTRGPATEREPYGKLLFKGMKNHPKDARGEYQHVIEYDGVEYVAKAKIIKFSPIGADEGVEKPAPKSKGVAQPKQQESKKPSKAAKVEPEEFDFDEVPF